jgi:hypothetical protein
MAATGLPEFTKSRTNATAELSSRNLSGFVYGRFGHRLIHANRSGRLQVVVTRLDVTGFQRQQLNLCAVLGQLRARRLEFDLLDTVGSQNGYLLALQ